MKKRNFHLLHYLSFIHYILLISIGLFLFGHCQKNINIIFYNVENLFDAKHDPQKNDWAFVPINHPQKKEGCDESTNEFFRKICLKTDWNNEKVKIKIDQIAKVINRSFPGRGPDLIGLVEIENENILKTLAKKIGYKYIIYPSPDKRGITQV